jgi:3-deoxy-manno-octulosonate cytidylyltransferase (CMP-KDO synthetase)
MTTARAPFVCVIPARYKSSRFPGKALAEIAGKSMVSRVWNNAQNAKLVERAIVATDDERIYEHCKKEGCEVMYTSKDCNDGSARIAEVAATLRAPYIFELQGDQPLVIPDVIDAFLTEARDAIVKNPSIDIVQSFAAVSDEDAALPDVVKVAVSKSNRMLLITRHPIKSGYRTLGLYLWKREALLAFPSMPITDYERAETCHLLRFFLNDLYVQGVLLDSTDWIEVDRPHHVQEVEAVLARKGLA